MGKRSRIDPGHWEDEKLREVEEPVRETETEGAAMEEGGKPGGATSWKPSQSVPTRRR